MSSIIRATTTSGLQVAPDNSGSLVLQTNGTTTAVTIDTSQNVGIGTTSPTNYAGAGKVLQVNNSSSLSEIRLTNSSTGSGAGAYGTVFQQNGNDLYIYNGANSFMAFGTNNTERMRIDSSGRITMPYQPAFSASSSSGTTTISAGALVPFNNELFDRGNNYNPSTYIFTAPIAGYYFFMATFYLQGASSLCFKVNGSEYGAPTPLAFSASSDQYDTGRSMSFIVSLSANDTVSVASRSIQSSVFYGPHSNWLGYFLG